MASQTVQGAPSLIENRQSLSNPIKQHFVEWFSGDALASIWTIGDSGSGSSAMVDAIDEGFSMITEASLNRSRGLEFNDIRHYSNTGSKVIHNSRLVTGTAIIAMANGLANQWGFNQDFFYIGADTGEDSSNFGLRTADGSTISQTSLGVSLDTNWHNFTGELKSSSSSAWLDGKFATVKTTNLPTLALMPHILVQTLNTAAKEARIRYLEAFNTEV